MHHLKEFSIELELNRNYWSTLRTQYPGSSIQTCSQSAEIYEAVDFHKVTQAKEIFATIEEYYKDKFPIGEDRRLSGGVHLHTWNKKTPQEEANKSCMAMFAELLEVHQRRSSRENQEICKTLISKFKNSLLFCKLYRKDGKLFFFSRPGYRSTMSDGAEYSISSKGSFMTLKTGNHYSQTSNSGSLESIEWRLNNVISDKIGAYYLAIILAYQYDVNLKNIKEDWRSTVSNGIGKTFSGGGHCKLEELATEFPQNAISEENMGIWQTNMNQLYSLLYACGYDEEATQFKEYLAEYGVPVQLQNFLWTTNKRKTCLVTTMTGVRVLPRIKKIIKSISYTGHVIEHSKENGLDILKHNNWECAPTKFIDSRWNAKTAYVVYTDDATKKIVVWSNRLPGYKITHLDSWTLRNYNEGKEEGMSATFVFKKERFYLHDKLIYQLMPKSPNSNPTECNFGPIDYNEDFTKMQFGIDLYESPNKLGWTGQHITAQFIPGDEVSVTRTEKFFKVYTIEEFKAYQETIIGTRKKRAKKTPPVVIAPIEVQEQERIDFAAIAEGPIQTEASPAEQVYAMSGLAGTWDNPF